MSFIEEICFKVISNAGEAKSLSVEAIDAAESNDYKLATKLMKDAENAITLASRAHMELLSKEAAGEEVNLSMLLMHAEDQLLSTQTIMVLSQKIINIHRKFENN